MKTINTLLLALLSLPIIGVEAQVKDNETPGISPDWGPIGYPEVRYYYLPDLETYYDIKTTMFIYVSNGRWIQNMQLAPFYRAYNLYAVYKVALTQYFGEQPHSLFNQHKEKYPRGFEAGKQVTIGRRINKAIQPAHIIRANK